VQTDLSINLSAAPRPFRAAVRMSSDHQKYSTQNQAEVIAAYTAVRGLRSIRSYADESLSGLGIGLPRGP
jgi:hypothetical protein